MPSRDRRDDAMPGRGSGRDSFAAVRMTGGSPPVARWAGAVALLLGLAIAKPWGGAPSPAAPSAPASRDRAVAMSRPVATVDPYSAGSAIATICLDPSSWRIATIERWRDQTIRVWRAIEPRPSATGPEDDRVPITSLVSEGVIELGWCAPVLGTIRIAGNAAVEVWRRTAVGVLPVTLTSHRPGPGTSPYGALYGSPTAAVSAASAVALWNDGTYVFHQRAPNGDDSWFGVNLERRPSTGSQG